MATKKHTYHVSTPNGTFSRTTAHVYRFLVCSLGENPETIVRRFEVYKSWKNCMPACTLVDALVKNQRVIDAGQGKVHGWSGTRENAEKLVASLRAENNYGDRRGPMRNRGRAPYGYRNLLVVEVPQPQ